MLTAELPKKAKSLDGKDFGNVQAVEIELLQVLRRLAKSSELPPPSAPHEKVLIIQRDLQKALDIRFKSNVLVSLNEDLRATLSSLGRIAMYAENLPPKRFETLFAKYLGLSVVQSKFFELFQAESPRTCQRIFK